MALWKRINFVRTHFGEKPFKCDTCGLYFAVGSNLKTNLLRTHACVDFGFPEMGI